MIRDVQGDDVETGRTTVRRFIVSEDCGVIINPNVVEGQIAGGVIQGIGGVLYEHFVYDAEGNPLTTTYLDYLIPTSPDVPVIEYDHLETPATTNPGGFKGMGEGGAIGAPAAAAKCKLMTVAQIPIDLRRLRPAIVGMRGSSQPETWPSRTNWVKTRLDNSV